MLKLRLSRVTQRFLENLPPKQFRQLVKKMFALLENPRPGDAQAMKGYPLLRTDTGEYRVIYDIQGDTLRIVLVGKRNDDEIYRQLGRGR